MAEFKRGLSRELIDCLKQEELFQKKLYPDMRKATDAVFPAIRNESIAFYYKGGGVFTFGRNGFRTHKKYCVGPSPDTPDYLTEQEYKSVRLPESFMAGYELILERCQKYGGIEAEGVSELYGASGLSDSPVILLDTEVCFDAAGKEENDGKRLDRIDLLLYNTENRQLCFCEAKHFSNSELWAKKGTKPQVCKQIDRYNITIARDGARIVSQYQNYVEDFNQLFGTDIPKPESIYPKTGLLIFGYDSYQIGKLKDLLIQDGSLDEIQCYHSQSVRNRIEQLNKTITQ